MSNWTRQAQVSSTDYLRKNCPQYQPISEAPNSIMEVSGFDSLRGSGVDIDAFEERILIQERQKLYCCLDSAKNIWLIRNPWALRHKRPVAAGTPVIYYQKIPYQPEETGFEAEERQSGFSI